MIKLRSIALLLLFFASPNIVVKAQLDFNDVAPIFYNNCSSCHHEGGVAIFSLLTYEDVTAYTSSIRYDLITNHMPPWPPDTTYTAGGYPAKRFLHEKSISPEDKNNILLWITQGQLQGDPSRAPVIPTYGNTTYKLNVIPDLTLKIPTFASNANLSKPNAFNCFSIPTGLTTDRWIKAFEIVAGSLEAVHDVTISIDTLGTNQTDTSGDCYDSIGQVYVGRWTPGDQPTIFPEGAALIAGMKLPANSKIVLQIHYGEFVAGQDVGLIDSTKIRLVFYPEGATGIREIHSDVFIQNWGDPLFFGPDIEANKTYTITADPSTTQNIRSHALPPTSDISIFSINPHSHNICTIVTNYAHMGSDTIPLIRIMEWYYEWQSSFYFDKMVKIPAGYTLETERFFDNTFNNQHQPNSPTTDLNFGSATEDILIYDSFQWLDYQAGDELIDIKSLIYEDSLMIAIVGVEGDVNQPSTLQCFIYPNPAADKLSIYVSGMSNYSGIIYTVTGIEVMTIATFESTSTIDLTNVPDGLYIIRIIDENTNETISKKIVISD